MLKGGLKKVLSLSAVGFSFLGLSFLISTLLNPIGQSSAAPQTAEQTINSYSMSMSNDSNVNISVNPTSEQTIYAASNNVTVLNNCPAGATITLSMVGGSNALNHINDDSHKILATAEDTLQDNTWGVSLDAGTTWNAIPTIAETALKIYEKDSLEDTEFIVPVLYGVKTDNSTISGSYANDVIYTMIPSAGCLTYSISWDFGGADIPSEYPNVLNQNGTINLSILPKPTRAFYRFAGFTNGTLVFTGDETEADINPDGSSSVTIDAIWTPEPYTITYNLNGGTPVSNPTTYDVETETFTLINPTRTGYNFAGWTGSNGSTAQTSVSVTKGSNGNKTFTANWTAVNYSISYTMNGGACSSYINSYTIETNTFSLCTPTRNGYTFAGWTGSNGTNRQTSVSIPKGSTGNKSYTANWTAVTYSISYNLNSGSASNPTSYTIETNTFTLNNPTRGGYNFTGWSGTGLSGSANKTVTISKGSTGNRSYTANWAAVCLFSSKEFGYTGGVQSWTVPTGCGGTYKLEVWGAQGGAGGGSTGGLGGYSYGNASLSDGSVVYVAVGGQGSYVANRSNSAGGWNGGGGCGNLDGNNYVGTGGGATHMAKTNRGVLSNYNSYRTEVYLVAGGGGGGFGIWWDEHYISYNGSNGGGTSGGGGNFGAAGTGGNQGGGGGGWSGGLSARPATGGTGYVGGVSSGATTAGQRSGNGYAKITRV